ncbi:MAG: GxxExxY protein [Parcubacteria group bacterium]|jgi:GxxExxY protein
MEKLINTNNKNTLIYPELSYEIIGILYDIHNELGNKYQEKYYQRAIEIEFIDKKISFKKELPANLVYKGNKIGKYFLDFLIENKIILEIKTTDSFKVRDFKQVSAYLKNTNMHLGILANFRTEKLTYKRILNPDYLYSN